MKKTFLPLTALALLALVSCGTPASSAASSSSPAPSTTSEPAPSSQAAPSSEATPSSEAAPSSEAEPSSEPDVSSAEPITYDVAINNKDALTAEWHFGEADRKVNITVTPAGNVAMLIQSGALTIVSSNTEVITITGQMAKAVGVGKATITVTYEGKTDSVEITISEKIHGAFEDDPLSPEEALTITKALEANGKSEIEYYIEGYVTLIASAYDSGYKNATFYIGSTADKTKEESFYLYRIGVDSDELGAKILKGAKVLVKCTLYNYNGNTPENSGGKLLSAEGGQASVRPTGKGWEQANPFTVAEARTRCASLEANVNDEFDCFVTGIITKIDEKTATYATFYIGDTADATDVLEVFKLPLSEGQDAKVLKGATVLVNVYLKKYKSTSDPSKPEVLETAGISGEKLISAEGGSSYVPKTGKGWEETNPFSVTEALAEAVNPEQDAYVKGVISKVGTYSTQYKNVDVTLADIDDPTKTILIYRVGYKDQDAFDAALKDKVGFIAIAKGKIGSYKDVNQITNPTLTVTDQKPEVTPATEPAIITKTVEEILALGDKDINNQLYQFTGILEGKKDDDQFGNGYVTDPLSGKSVKLYGNTTTATVISFDGSTGVPVYSYKNAKDANTTLKDIHNGDVVTVKGLWSGSHGNFSAVTTSHETTDEKYNATVDLGIEHGSVRLSKLWEIAYGEEVTVTATPDEGYVLEKLVVVNAQGTETDITASKKFNATCINVVKATFALDDIVSAGKFTVANPADTASNAEVTNGDTIKGWLTASEGATVSVSAVSGMTKVFGAANGGSGDNAWKTNNVLKLGSSSAAGKITITLSAAVTKVSIAGWGWKNSLTVKVNGVESTAFRSNLANKANVEAKQMDSGTFVFAEPTDTIAIETVSTALVINSFEVFAKKAA